jgi:hypothetical protein
MDDGMALYQETSIAANQDNLQATENFRRKRSLWTTRTPAKRSSSPWMKAITRVASVSMIQFRFKKGW